MQKCPLLISVAGDSRPSAATTPILDCWVQRSDTVLVKVKPGGWSRKPPKPANEVTTSLLPPATPPETDGQRTASSSEPDHELIELELSRGRNAMGIFQDLVDVHEFTGI